MADTRQETRDTRARRRFFLSCLVSPVSCLIFCASVVRSAEPLVPDKNLDAAIKANLPHHTGDLTEKALADLYRLDASHKGIASLAGLEQCPHLMEVFLADNQIADLKPLAGLKNLQSLTLSKNRIADLAPLRDLTKLQFLEVSDNAIADLGPLGGLTALSAMYVTGNKITDVGPVASLTKLASLSVGRNQIKDLGPVGKLIKVVTLDLQDNQIADVTPLEKLHDVTLLNLAKNRVIDLEPLVESCKADAAGAKRFAPYLRLYLSDNPIMKDPAKTGQLDALKSAGVRLNP
jgi:internalin A